MPRYRASAEAVERYHDPSFDSLVRVAIAPCSPFSVTADLLREAAVLARSLEVRLHTHASETLEEDADRRERFGMTPTQYLESVGWLGSDVVMAHCVHLDDKQDQPNQARNWPSVKAGRTHLMDATPVTLGQELGGYAAQVGAAEDRLRAALPRVGQLPIGGTAVGTGINAPAGFGAAVAERLAADMGLPLSEAPDHFAAQGARDELVSLSGELRALAAALLKIANDLRWMASGPKTGLAEIRLPDLQPGSSIMPGKVNPVIPEAVSQVVAQVYGNDAAVAFAGSQGSFELNVYLPVMARNLLESIRLLGSVSRLFADRCIDGIEVDVERCRTYAEATPQAATALNPLLGYEQVAALVKESAATGKSIRTLVLEQGLVPEAELDAALDLLRLTRGG